MRSNEQTQLDGVPPSGLVRVPIAARFMGVPPSTFRAWLRDDPERFQPVRLGGRSYVNIERLWRIAAGEI